MDIFLNTVRLTLCYSIPSNIIVFMMALVFWGADYRLVWKRVILLAAILPVISDVTVTLFPIWLHTLFYMTVFIILFFAIFKEWSRLEQIVIIIFFSLATVINELLTTIIGAPYIDFEHRLETYHYLLFLWPLMIIYGAFTILMARKNLHPGKSMLLYFKRRQKSLVPLLLFLFLQFVLVLMITAQILPSQPFTSKASTFLLITVEVLSIFIFYITLGTISQMKEETVKRTQEVYLSDIENLFTTVRGQRHDFLNHVQVIRSMIERNKLDDLLQYTKDLLGEIDEINEVISIGHPAVCALIQSKTAVAMNHKIKFEHHFHGLSEITSSIKIIDLVKIMGNLLDNAFDEVLELPPADRWVTISGVVEEGIFRLEVNNAGQTLSEDELNLIFQPGYSTKNKERHSGLGLSIVKEQVERYKGKIEVDSNADEGTLFRLTLSV